MNRRMTRSWLSTGENLLKVTADEIPVAPMSLLIGDIIQNTRSSLDHIAYALATEFTKPLTQESAVESQFPIFGDENRKGIPGNGAKSFRESGLGKMIKCVDPNAQAFIDRLQPYQLGQNFKTQLLRQFLQISFIHSGHKIGKVNIMDRQNVVFMEDDLSTLIQAVQPSF